MNWQLTNHLTPAVMMRADVVLPNRWLLIVVSNSRRSTGGPRCVCTMHGDGNRFFLPAPSGSPDRPPGELSMKSASADCHMSYEPIIL